MQMVKSRQSTDKNGAAPQSRAAKARTRSGRALLESLNLAGGKVRKAPAKPAFKPAEAAEKRPAAAAPIQVRFAEVGPESDGQRLDNFLLRELKGVPKSHIYRLIRSGEVRVNKARAKAETKLISGDTVRIPPVVHKEASESAAPKFDDIPTVLYEDADLLIVDKPAGIASHGGSGIAYGLIERMRASRPESKFLELAHRLDKETSGAIIMAKTRKALVRLHDMMREGEVHKTYRTLVKGDWVNDRQHIKLPLYRYLTPSGERRVRVDEENGQFSHSIFRLLRRFGAVSYLEVDLKTGRTHQIRVHAASQKHPLIGDEKYGDFSFNTEVEKGALGIPFKRMFLHAWRLEFNHPVTGAPMIVECPLPSECTDLIEYLENTAK